AQLPGGPVQQRLGHGRVALTDEAVRGEVAVADGSTDPQSTPGHLLDAGVGDLRHVDEQGGLLDAESHQVDEVRAAAEVLPVRIAGEQRDGTLRVVGALVAKRLHRASSRTAGTMLA